MYSSRNLEDLRPDVAKNARMFQELCQAEGLAVLVTNTVRDEEYQKSLYAQGRTTPGSIVTNSPRPAFHAKGVGLAFDFCKNRKGHAYDDPAFFERCGLIGERVGFEWGGRWSSFPDRPHLQWSGPKKDYKSADLWSGRLPPNMPPYQVPPTTDNLPADWEREAVDWAVAQGILRGTPGGDQKLHQSVTKAELCIMLQRYHQGRNG